MAANQPFVKFNKNWEKWEKRINPREFTRRFGKIFMTDTLPKIGFEAIKIVIKDINAKKYEANKQSTIDRKKSSTPLIDHNDLVRSATFKIPDPFTLVIGVNKNVVWNGEKVNIAAVLHEGARIEQPTRNLVIKIPARKYLETPLESDEFVKIFSKLLQDGIAKVMKGKK
jgi:hypothetical protein